MPGLLPRAWTSHNLSGLKRLWSFWPGLQDLPVSHSRPWIGRETFIRCPKACAMHDGRKGGASACKMEATTAGVGRLEEEALRRKERLKALREKTGRKTHEGTGGLPAWPLHGTKWLHFSPPKAIQLFLRVFSKGYQDKEDGEPKTKHLREEEEEGEKHRELRLRNYVPEDEDLKKRRVPQAKPVAVEEKVKEQLEAAKPEPVIEEVVSAWAALAYSLLLCVLFLFATCSPSAPHSFSSLLYSLPTCLFALVPLLPPPLFPISLLPKPALPLPWGGPSTLICVFSLPRTWPTSLLGSLTGECYPCGAGAG
uniref:Uncharacterized protein n=1 Tax=Piliocolobus tephrosceles TaxID=591936 RepID=A0A8C9GPU2_9PRIM